MGLTLRYIEDEMSFEFSEEVNIKLSKLGDTFFFETIMLLKNNIPIPSYAEDSDYVCGVIGSIFFKFDFERYEDLRDLSEYYLFHDFNIITSDEYLDSINSNKYLKHGINYSAF